jgi:HPt (histidine-containing phosphotransfer) domain-containing protein
MKTAHVRTIGDDDLPALDTRVIGELRELVDEDDPDFLNEIIAGYLKNAAENIKVVAEHAQNVDAEGIEVIMMTAHTLKGSSKNVGAVAMAHYSSELELLSRRGGNPEKTSELLERLEVELERFKVELKKSLNVPQASR